MSQDVSKQEPREVAIVVNEHNHHFELPIGEDIAYIEYSIRGDVLSLYFILVPESYRGKGHSKILIHFALDFAKENNLKVKVYCSFIARYLAMHPELEYVKA